VSLLGLRAAIVAGCKAAVPSLRTCEAHGGRFAPEDLKRYATGAPAVLVACLGAVSVEQTAEGEADGMLRWAAFVLATDKAGHPRDAGALAVVEALLSRIPGNRFADAANTIPYDLRADNLYSGAVDKLGIALWAITWRQGTTLGAFDEATLAVFSEFRADWNLAGDPDQIDAQDLVALQENPPEEPPPEPPGESGS
jgi:phage gp37-like protein